MSGEEKPDGDNIVSLKQRPAATPLVSDDAAESGTLANLLEFCERLDQGMKLMIETVVAMEKRIRRLELAQQRAEAAKPKPVILDARGKKAN